jgi:predicted dehydrogenase
VELTGSEGTVIVQHDRIIAADLHTPLTEQFAPVDENTNPSANSPVVSDINGHKSILRDFLRAIETDAMPRCDGREGRRSVELVEAIYESARTGQAVTLTGN